MIRFYIQKDGKGLAHAREGDHWLCGYAPGMHRMNTEDLTFPDDFEHVALSNPKKVCQYCAGHLKPFLNEFERNCQVIRQTLNMSKRYKSR